MSVVVVNLGNLLLFCTKYHHEYKKASASCGINKKRVITMETKLEITAKHENCMHVITIARKYGRNPSTITTILKQKDAIKATKPSKGVTVLSNKRTRLNDEIERFLLSRIKQKKFTGNTVRKSIIFKSKSSIYDNFVKNIADKENNKDGTLEQRPPPEFKASHSWFEKFKHPTGIHSV